MRHKSDHTFSRVPSAEIPRSMFNRSHGYKTTFDAGRLIPFYVDEALPGDTFSLNVSMFARLATPVYPLMDNMYLDVFFFAIPNRLVWSNWQRFCGEQSSPGDSTDYLVPVVSSVGGNELAHYMGMPSYSGVVPTVPMSALFMRAYNLVWNEWFRDQNLQTPATVPLGDGPDNENLYTVRRRGKRHDYFTSALPWPQKGPGVELPISGYADVIRDSASAKPKWLITDDVDTEETYLRLQAYSSGGTGNVYMDPAHAHQASASQELVWGTDVGLKADLGTSTAVTINAMREAFAVQKLLERDARGGTRYTEIVRAHFGVVSPDARLQRPEFLGGGSAPVVISPVAQTYISDGVNSPMGTLAGYGTVAAHRRGFTKSFTEHTILLGLVMVRADLTYQQGIPRMFSRRTRYEFYWPAFAHLGEQPIYNKELYAHAPYLTDESVFGYQERYAEYRYHPSVVTGLFRSQASGSLDAWHLAQEFSALPTLGDTFIQENPPVDRVIAVPDQPHFLFDSWFDIRCARPMPVYSVPGQLDHF